MTQPQPTRVNPPPLNGGRPVLASIRIDPDRPELGLYVLVDRGPVIVDRYVVAFALTLDDSEWSTGEYLSSYADAIEALVRRLG